MAESIIYELTKQTLHKVSLFDYKLKSHLLQVIVGGIFMAIKELAKNKYKLDIPIGYNGNKRIRHIETFYGTKKKLHYEKTKLNYN